MSAEVRPVTPYECPKCHALWLHWPKEQTGQATDSLNLRSVQCCDHCESAGVDGLQRLERVPATLAAPYEVPGQALDFGDAIRALKAGKRVARAGWNGKGMWLSLSCGPGGDAAAGRREIAFENFWSANNSEYARQNGGSAVVLPCITMKTATGEILMGWLASQTDMLADDWVVL